MGTEKTSVSKKLHNIKLKEDRYSVKSKEYLRYLLYNIIKGVFVGSLRSIETRLGRQFPAFDSLRAEILRIGNDAIRECHEVIDGFNVEQIPDTLVFNFDKEGKGKEKTNG